MGKSRDKSFLSLLVASCQVLMKVRVKLEGGGKASSGAKRKWLILPRDCALVVAVSFV